MKQLLTLVALLVAILAASPLEARAQDSSTLSKKELKQIEKDAKNAAKAKEKDNWKVISGALPIVRQYEEAYKLQRMTQGGEKMYLSGSGSAVGNSFNVARAEAVEAAKLEIAKSLESEYIGESELNMGNRQISTEDASSLSVYNQSAINRVAQQLGRVNVVVETFKELPNKNVMVEVTVCYSSAKAHEIVKRAVQKDLEQRAAELKDRVRERAEETEFD